MSVKTFEEMIVETAALILAVDEFETLEGDDNAVVLAGLGVDRDIATLELLDYVSSNPMLRILLLARSVDQLNGPDLSAMSKEDLLRTLFGSTPEE